MKYKVVKKGNRYIKKRKFDTADWITILIVIVVFCMAMITMILGD